ncbi:AbrB/MazE/SpoVT family DNA-binding domain-containing protein [Pseudomonas mandelii]|uniref:AbrB/MazE/SpoVT family DNA-binding domain-containing protein n=1 Tax=Pseudomonas mandelii TaxID=75612 RepID=UPI0020A06E65|nr:AbrB/MazE/SpoVT family DNA-binding domain-containing protein [Pseudomonas mandelii]MCO8313373.1 AbrB/MazE/SpoVT family DNA-binding domain-containing protein [Pseudomonas mandelii]
MAMATLTSKGRVTLPAELRASLGLRAGDRVQFVSLENGSFEIMAVTCSARTLKGLIRKPAKPVHIKDMAQAGPAR